MLDVKNVAFLFIIVIFPVVVMGMCVHGLFFFFVGSIFSSLSVLYCLYFWRCYFNFSGLMLISIMLCTRFKSLSPSYLKYIKLQIYLCAWMANVNVNVHCNNFEWLLLCCVQNIKYFSDVEFNCHRIQYARDFNP